MPAQRAITRTSPARGSFARADFREQGTRLYERRNYTPERVAENILRAVGRNRAVAPVSPEAWALYFLKTPPPVPGIP